VRQQVAVNESSFNNVGAHSFTSTQASALLTKPTSQARDVLVAFGTITALVTFTVSERVAAIVTVTKSSGENVTGDTICDTFDTFDTFDLKEALIVPSRELQ
jgi:hypothetical protein